jgi:hypothetical protein
MQLASLHSEYGIHQLQANFEYIRTVFDRPDYKTVQSYAHSMSANSDFRECFVNNVINEKDLPSTLDHLDSPEPNESAGRTDPHCEPMQDTPDIPETNLDSSTLTEKPNLQPEEESKTELASSIDEIKTDASKSHQSKIDKSDTKSTSSRNSDTPTQETSSQPKLVKTISSDTRLSHSEINHITKDLETAIESSYRLFTSMKRNARLNELHETIIFEYDILVRAGTKYEPAKEQTLNHPIAITKELAKTHSVIAFDEFMNGNDCSENKFCLMSFKPMKITSQTANEDDILEVLTDYVRSLLRKSTLHTADKEILATRLQTKFESRSNLAAYNWVKSRTLRPTQIGNRRPQSDKGHDPLSPKKESKTQERLLSHEQQQINEKEAERRKKLSTILATQLSLIVEQSYQHENVDPFHMITDDHSRMNITMMFVNHLINTNKGWMNPVTTKSVFAIKRISDYFHFELSDNESEIQLKVIRHTLTTITNKVKT